MTKDEINNEQNAMDDKRKPKLKIIQICAAYKPAYIYGGPTMSVSKLSEELANAGQDVTVLTTTANGKNELDVPKGQAQLVDGVKVYYFKRLTKDHTHFSPALLTFLHQTIKRAKRETPNPELIVHIHAWWNLVSIFSCLVARLHGVKVILSPRGMLTSYSLSNRNSKFKDAIHFFLGKSLLKYCHIHATSDKEKRDVLQTAEVRSVSIVPNFVRFPKVITHATEEHGVSYRLLFLSRIEEKKGLELLFEALSQVNIPYQLSIAGTGEISYVESLKALSIELNIHSKITWLGHVGNEHKFELLAQNDLMVLTSFNENFANVVIESLAMGTPVLVSEEVGLADYVLNNNLGWGVPLTINDIKTSLEGSFSAIQTRNHIRKQGPLVIRHDFEENNLIKNYLALYQKTNI